MTSTAQAVDMAAQRGPRYCVTGMIRPHEHAVSYADDAEEAERIREGYETAGYHQLQVYPPAEGVNL